VVVESESLPSSVDCFPVTAIAAVVPGGISVESMRPTADRRSTADETGAGDIPGDCVESLLGSGFSAVVAVAGGISTTITSCASITPADFVCSGGFSDSSTT